MLKLEEYGKAIGAFFTVFIGTYLMMLAGSFSDTSIAFSFAELVEPIRMSLSTGLFAALGAWGFSNKVNGQNVMTIAKQTKNG